MNAKTIDQIIARIQALDLDAIKFKAMDGDEGYGWSREQANQNEIEYKRFLSLLVKYPETMIAPNKTVDKFWHAHILDTMKYAEDCQNVFGYFLHHFPYFGMRGAEDAANLAQAAVATARLYQQEYSESSAQPAAYCGAAASYCGATSAKAEPAASCGPGSVSYCGATSAKAEATAEAAAYCGAALASYCGASADKVAAKPEEAAYCGATSVAYCGATAGAGKPVSHEAILKTAMRPALPCNM